MRDRTYSVLPASVLLACVALAPVAAVLGILYGLGTISGGHMTWIVLAAVAVFVPWAVSQLDPRSVGEQSED